MSKIFNKIADYQSDRYQQNTRLLKQSEETVKDFTTAATKDVSFKQEQTKLNTSLDQLVEYAKQIKEKRAEPYYKDLKSNIEKFRNTIIQNPYTSNQFDYTTGMASSFANRYQVENNRNAAIQNIKSEIRSFKGMLLSRRNFPIVSTRPPMVPAPTASVPTTAAATATPTATNTSSTPPIPTKTQPGAFSNVDANLFHPRRKASYRSELAAQASKNTAPAATTTTTAAETTTTTTTTEPTADVKSTATTVEEVKEL